MERSEWVAFKVKCRHRSQEEMGQVWSGRLKKRQKGWPFVYPICGNLSCFSFGKCRATKSDRQLLDHFPNLHMQPEGSNPSILVYKHGLHHM